MGKILIAIRSIWLFLNEMKWNVAKVVLFWPLKQPSCWVAIAPALQNNSTNMGLHIYVCRIQNENNNEKNKKMNTNAVVSSRSTPFSGYITMFLGLTEWLCVCIEMHGLTRRAAAAVTLPQP